MLKSVKIAVIDRHPREGNNMLTQRSIKIEVTTYYPRCAGVNIIKVHIYATKGTIIKVPSSYLHDRQNTWNLNQR